MAGGDEVVSDSGDVDGVPGDDGVCEQVEAVGLVVLVVVSPTADLASITTIRPKSARLELTHLVP